MVEWIDLNFQEQPGVIASYVLRGPRGVALVETGPASTYQQLLAGLASLGIEPRQITDILVTHIHLDHAGAAGWLARETGAAVHVHAVGAPHLAEPGKLLISAQRIYGDAMDRLWGQTLPAPADQIHALYDGDVFDAAGLSLTAVDTPGHAYHHMAYLLDGLCFSGDVAAIRLPGLDRVLVPTPPPEIDLPAWRSSLARLRDLRPDRLLLTHFGPSPLDTLEHLRGAEAQLEAQAEFVCQRWEKADAAETILAAYREWIARLVAPSDAGRVELIVPSEMCVAGLVRYFEKQGSK